MANHCIDRDCPACGEEYCVRCHFFYCPECGADYSTALKEAESSTAIDWDDDYTPIPLIKPRSSLVIYEEDF